MWKSRIFAAVSGFVKGKTLWKTGDDFHRENRRPGNEHKSTPTRLNSGWIC